MCEERGAERMVEEITQGSGSSALANDLSPKPLSEGKRDLDKESTLNVCSIFCHISQCAEVFYI
ncbi:hypothetical protein N321_13634, partial [Antrostomus carolinensis]